MNIIEIKNLNFKYSDKPVFDDFNLEIKEGTFTTIIGLNGSGKSTLLRIILGLIKCEGEIKIDNLLLNETNIKEIRKKIGVVFDNPDNQFVVETVMDDIAFSLENLQLKSNDIKRKVREIANYIGITKLLNKEPSTLSGGEKQLVALASALVHEPKILILDEALTMVDINTRKQIYNILKDIHKTRNITIINVTHEMEELLYCDDIILIDNGNIILNGPKEEVLLEEKVFNKLNLELPFMASLSIKLKYYGLVDKLMLDMDEMVNEIWK